MFIAYLTEEEVLVTTEELEERAIQEWFTDGDREIDGYKRKVFGAPGVRIFNSQKLKLC